MVHTAAHHRVHILFYIALYLYSYLQHVYVEHQTQRSTFRRLYCGRHYFSLSYLYINAILYTQRIYYKQSSHTAIGRCIFFSCFSSALFLCFRLLFCCCCCCIGAMCACVSLNIICTVSVSYIGNLNTFPSIYPVLCLFVGMCSMLYARIYARVCSA